MNNEEQNSVLSPPAIFGFNEFTFDAGKRILWRGAKIVLLAPKACEILGVLIENAPQILSREEVMNQVWNDSFVEEANLTHHISALRKALGEDKNGRKFIETIPRKGYRFVAPVSQSATGNISEITISERVTESFVEEIEQIDDSPTKQIPTSPRHNLLTRNKFSAFSAAILLAVLGVLAVYFYAASQTVNDAPSRVAVTFNRVSDDKSIGCTTLSPDGKFVAYIQNYSDAGGGSLYIRQLETNREVQLLEPDERTFGSIDFSPDGSLIYYISFEKNAKIGVLYSISILGGNPKRLIELDPVGSYFALSPDGKRAAFYRRSSDEKTISLVLAPLDGTSEIEQAIFSIAVAESFFGETLAWSPDNRSIAFGQIQLPEPKLKVSQIDIHTGAISRLADEDFKNIGKMHFNSDGRELFFVGEKERYTQKIYALDTASRKIRQVTNDGDYYGNYGLGISADGKLLAADLMDSKSDIWNIGADGDLTDAADIKRGTLNGKRGIAGLADGAVVYTARIGEKRDIWKVNADGSNAQPLTNDAFTEKDLTASRDGKKVAFASDRAAREGSENWHLFVMNADGSSLRQITFGDTSDIQPDFSPDGNQIVYVSTTAGKSVLKKNSVSGGTPVELTDYAGVNPVYSPDGTRIALKILSPTRSQLAEIAIISADGGKPEKTFPVLQFEFFEVVFPIRWTPDGAGVIFRREKNGIGNLWQQDVNSTAAPRQLTSFSTDTIYNFAYSTDGKRLLISRGFYQTNAVIIQNFQP